MSQEVKFYRQCTLVNGNLRTVSHLPEKFAFVGSKVKLKDNDVWRGGWEVVGIGELVPANIAEHRAHAYQDIWKPSTAISTRGNK